MEQLQKKLEFVEYLFSAFTTPPFFLELSAWSRNRLAKKHGAELKNVEQSSLKHPLRLVPLQEYFYILSSLFLHPFFFFRLYVGLRGNGATSCPLLMTPHPTTRGTNKSPVINFHIIIVILGFFI